MDNSGDALERPQLGSKAVFSRTLQECASQLRQLRSIQPCRTPGFGNGTQRIETAFIQQRLPGVYGLARHAHRFGHIGAFVARKQQTSGSHPFLRRFAHSLSCHVHTPQYRYRE